MRVTARRSDNTAVDPTEARKATVRRFGRSDRSEQRLISGGERRIPRYRSWASGDEDRGMLIADAQRDSRTVYVGGFVGQLVSSIVGLASAVVAALVDPVTGFWTLAVGGAAIF